MTQSNCHSVRDTRVTKADRGHLHDGRLPWTWHKEPLPPYALPRAGGRVPHQVMRSLGSGIEIELVV